MWIADVVVKCGDVLSGNIKYVFWAFGNISKPITIGCHPYNSRFDVKHNLTKALEPDIFAMTTLVANTQTVFVLLYKFNL